MSFNVAVSNIGNVRENKPIIVLFFSPECFYCKKMKPDWEDFKKYSPINYSEVPVEEMYSYSRVEDEENITGYPTIRLYNNGKLVKEYDGDRSKKDIMKFIKKYVKTKKPKKKKLLLVKSNKTNTINKNLLGKLTKQTRKRNKSKKKKSKKK